MSAHGACEANRQLEAVAKDPEKDFLEQAETLERLRLNFLDFKLAFELAAVGQSHMDHEVPISSHRKFDV